MIFLDRKKLNKEQREACKYIDGPLLIVAGPGTGKTHLLSVRAANIIEEKRIHPENILILTYTNSAAKAVKERLSHIIGFEGYRIYADTFHGFANSVILDSDEAASYIQERIPLSDVERIACLEFILNTFSEKIRELRPFGRPYFYIQEISKRISDLKNEGILPERFERYVESLKPDAFYIEKKHIPRLKELAFIYKKYEELKQGKNPNIFDERGRYDYDDMIMIALQVLEREKELREYYCDRFRYIMVDEFQDTNGAQLKLLFLLCKGERPNLCCVGDDDQSIYRFQGANIANFRILIERYPEIRTIKLKNNYRSTEEIVKLSTDIINQIPHENKLISYKELKSKTDYSNKNIEFRQFTTEEEEIIYIINKVKEIKKIIEYEKNLSSEERERPYNQIAVLVRKRAYMLKLIEAFLNAGIPYATDGKEDISGYKRVRQLMDVLLLAKLVVERSSLDEKDLVLYRVLSCDFFEIPQSDLIRFIAYTKRDRTPYLFEAFFSSFPVADLHKRPSFGDTKNLEILKHIKLLQPHRLHIASWTLHRLHCDADTRPTHDLIMGFIEDAGLYRFILREYDKNKILLTRELRTLTSFVNLIKNESLSKPDMRLSDFISNVERMKLHSMPIQGQLVSATQDGVRILTAHGAKGLEFHTCFIPFCVQDKSWPVRMQTARIPLPPELMKSKKDIRDKSELAKLHLYDETRLFYVAASRAKSNIIFTSSPRSDDVTSSFFNNLNITVKRPCTDETELLKDFLEKKGYDPLKDTEIHLRDMVRNVYLTPTRINTYLRCKRKFFYTSLLLLPGRKRQSLVFGDCCHRALEETYRKYKLDNKFPDFWFFKEAFLKELRYQGVNKSIENWCVAKLGDVEKWFNMTREKAVFPIELEKKKIITLKKGVIFTGKFDKIEFENENEKTIRIIDYKTGKPDDHLKKLSDINDPSHEDCDDYLRQLVAYKMLYERDIYERPQYKVTHGMLVFLEPIRASSRKYDLKKGAFVDRKIPITNDMVDKLENVILNIWERVQNLDFEKLPERDSNLCNRCDYDSICWS